MQHGDVENTLLSGTLAVQAGLATREDVQSAIKTWAVRKDRPLAEVLTELGTLNDSRRDLLEALTQEVLARHDGDPSRSLGAVATEPALASLLDDVTEAEFRAGLTHLTVEEPTRRIADGPKTTRDRPIPPSRYRIIRPHARGGLGEVFLAQDGELNREVALKEIQDRHADRVESRSRFVLEAEITGGLEHPGIVPVYGLGTYGDGRPYYAMRFIRGDSMKDAVARFHAQDGARRDPVEHALAFRDLIRRFVDVCNAMAYAHSRRVLHRDLKPGNIMLGKYGETLVVDWGLAKPLDLPESLREANGEEKPLLPSSLSGSVETLPGSSVGTPQYMSPEQAEGRLDDLGPASDIYSLGATLYTILTGRPAFDAPTVGQVVEKVIRGEFPRPRTVAPQVPRPLEAICLKAMALRPEDRYATARDLAIDVEHWLGDEPVSCYREPLLTRLARWGRRNRSAVAGAAVLLATAIPTLTIANILIDRERHRAEVSRERAEDSFRIAQASVDSMLTHVGEIELADIPQMEQVRKRLLHDALGLYQGLLVQEADDANARSLVARAEVRVGEIRALLGESVEAEASFRRGIRAIEALIPLRPADVSLRRDLARAYTRLGELLKKLSRFDEAETALKKAMELRQQQKRDFPTSAEDARLEADATYHLGTLLARVRRRDAKDEEAYRSAMATQRALIEQGRDRPEVRADLARSLNNLGILLRGSSPSDAEAAFREAMGLLRALHGEAPTVVAHQWRLARACANLVTLLHRKGWSEEAAKLDRESFGHFERLAAEFPGIPEYRQELASLLINRAILRSDAGDVPAAEASARRSLELLDPLVLGHPDAPVYAQKRAAASFILGQVQMTAGRAAEAEVSLRDALKIQEDLLARFPESIAYRLEAGTTNNNLGVLHFALGDLDRARTELARARDLHREVLRVRPDDLLYRRHLLNDLARLAEVELIAGRGAVAAEYAEELPRLFPDDAEEHRRAARILARCSGLARGEDAQRLGDRAIALLKRALDLGFAQPDELKLPDYDPIRDRPGFRAILEAMESANRPRIGRTDGGARFGQNRMLS